MSVIETDVLGEPEVLTEAEAQLLNAERYLREHGWCRGRMQDRRGRVCIVGALTRRET